MMHGINATFLGMTADAAVLSAIAVFGVRATAKTTE